MAKRKKGFKIPDEIDERDPDICIDQDGNEIQLENLDKGKGVTLEVPFTSIGFSAAGSKEKEPQHHSIQGDITLRMTPNAKMEFKASDEIKADLSLGMQASAEATPASENKEPDLVNQKLQSLGFIFPKKYQEAFLGDLFEIRETMKGLGHPKWWIDLISYLKFIPLIIATIRIKLSDFIDPEKKSN